MLPSAVDCKEKAVLYRISNTWKWVFFIRLQVSEVKTLGNGLLRICEYSKKEGYCAGFIEDKRKQTK